MSLSGTHEWAKHTDNCLEGCEHNCRYCYARYNAVVRFKKVRAEDWPRPQVNWRSAEKKRGHREGGVMFPTTHDITPRFLEPCLGVILKNVEAGNRLLIVSKPHLYCIDEITRMLKCSDDVLFRFTIGAPNDSTLAYWEPGAPCLGERIASLRLAHERGFQTSISVEPLLDPRTRSVARLIDMVEKFVTHSIWIGMMNKAEQRVPIDSGLEVQAVRKVEHSQSANCRAIYEYFKGHPLVRWKESYRKALGLDLSETAEMAQD